MDGQKFSKDQNSVNIEACTEETRCLEGYWELFELLNILLFTALNICIVLKN